jgi:hypothetical protein
VYYQSLTLASNVLVNFLTSHGAELALLVASAAHHQSFFDSCKARDMPIASVHYHRLALGSDVIVKTFSKVAVVVVGAVVGLVVIARQIAKLLVYL